MTERYDEAAAAHYSAYRPLLHSLILGKVLTQARSAAVGLDVGCGTGHSAIALAKHCRHAHAFDRSLLMLARTAKHERVSYFGATGEGLPLRSDSVDLVTFAGSLFYLNRDATAKEILRVCSDGADVIVYDFEVHLEEFLQRCGIEPEAAAASDYDHRVNLSGNVGFVEVLVSSERVEVEMSAAELTHLLLADSKRLDRFAGTYRTSDPFDEVEHDLRSRHDSLTVQADVFYAKYLAQCHPHGF